MKRLPILFILLLLLPILEAQSSPEPPSVPSTTSLTGLISSIEELKTSISSIKKDMAEFKIQLNSSLSSDRRTNLSFMVLFFLASMFFFRVMERILDYVKWKNQRREIITFQDAVLERLLEIQDRLIILEGIIAEIEGRIKPAEVEILKAEEPRKGINRRFFRFLFLFIILITLVIYSWLTR